MREKAARNLVRIVGYCWDQSYAYHELGPAHLQRRWTSAAKKLDFLRKLAVKIDFDNATEQMAQEGWWG